jgi:MYXO-CTERM domain-containing protein
MTHQTRTPHRRAFCLLLTAVALPLTPLAAQPPADTIPPPVQAESPPSVATPVETPAQPTIHTPLPTITIPDPEPVQARAPAEPRAAPTRATSRTATRAPARAPVRAQPAPAADPAPAPQPAAETPAPAEAAPAIADAAPAVPPLEPSASPEPAPAEPGGSSTLLWVIGGLAALGLLAFFLLRRRRGDEPVRDEAVRDEVYEPAAAPVAASAMAAPPLAAAAMPVHDEPVAAAADESGRPWLDLVMRPRRAGVTGDEALVEFDLGVENHGTAPARDVRISTWMFPGGAGQESEMERALVDHRDEPSRPQGTIEPGAERRIDSSVALPTSGVRTDSVLPVVFAEARYVLPDGTEARTSATFAVGVPIGEELAHFDLENPSGLHEDVEARPLGEPERQ